MSIEEKKAKMAANRAINSKKPARSAFVFTVARVSN